MPANNAKEQTRIFIDDQTPPAGVLFKPRNDVRNSGTFLQNFYAAEAWPSPVRAIRMAESQLMKNLSHILRGGLLAIGWSVACHGAPAPSAADPFVKNPKATATPIASSKDSAPWQNYQTTVEVYALDRSDAIALLADESKDAGRYQRVRELVKTKKARLELLMAAVSAPGQEVVLVSMDTVFYATQFDHVLTRNGLVPPTAWELRPVGEKLSIFLDSSQNAQVCGAEELVLERTVLEEFRKVGGSANYLPVSQPIFDCQRLSTSFQGKCGVPQYLGLFSPHPSTAVNDGDAAAEEWLAFARIDVSGPAEKSETPADSNKVQDVALDYLCYSVEREAARDILAKSASLQSVWKDLQPLLEDGKARLETFVSMRGKSGQQINSGSGLQEERYPVEFESPGFPREKVALPEKNLPKDVASGITRAINSKELIQGFPTAFEMRLLGFHVKAVPTIHPDGTAISLEQSAGLTVDSGPLTAAGVVNDPPRSPVFTDQSVENQMTIVPGSPMLVGTLNPPGADGVNGRTDSGRTWLLFVRGNIVTP